MTATGKPDDGHEVGRPEPGEPAPDSWLEDDQPSAFPLLPGDEAAQDTGDYELVDDLAVPSEVDDPEDDPEEDDPEDDAPGTGAANAGDPEDDPENDEGFLDRTTSDRPLGDQTLSDQTIADLTLDESPRTMMLRGRGASGQKDAQQDGTDEESADDAAASPGAGRPVPPAPPMATSTDLPMPADPPMPADMATSMDIPMPGDMATSTDIPALPPFPYAQDASGAAQAPPPPAAYPHGQGSPDPTREEYLPRQSPLHPHPQAAHQQEAPPPPPPAAQPAPPAPPAPPSQSPPAHEPFPYAQQIPGPAPAAPAHEPFPFPQEIPDAQAAHQQPAHQQPAHQAAPQPGEPFPWAQQVPGTPPPGQGLQGPAAPPPVIEEPWRTEGKKGKKPKGPRKGVKKPLLIGVAGLAVAALVAAGAVFVPGLLDGDEEKDAGARLAGSIFPLNQAVRTDGRNQEFTGAAASGSTVVAVGGESGVDRPRGLFLVSADGGRTFASATVRGAEEDTTATTPPQVVAGSSEGWIAIGAGGSGGTVWTSSDGRSWTRQPDAVGRVFGPGNRVTQVVSTGNGFIAIGANSEKGDFSDAEAAIWTSPDGRQWETRVGDEIGLEVSRASYSLAEVAASGDTVLLKALVKPNNGKPPEYRKVWRSQDGGRTWTVSEVPVPSGSRGLTVGGGEAGFVAVRETGKKNAPYGQAFVSKDGQSWSTAGKLELDGYGHTMQVLGGSRGYTALVRSGGNVLLSHSTDGRSWKAAGSAPGKPGRKIAGGALAEDRTTLVGHDPGGGDLDPLVGVWDANGQQTPVDLAKVKGVIQPDHAVQAVGASGATAVAVGSASGDAAVWTSADGGTWKAAQGLGAAFTRPGSQRLLDVAAGEQGWLAVGYDQVAPKRPLVVVSKDAATWQTADSAAPFGTSKGKSLATNAAAAGSAGYVVVGSDGPSAAAWFSADLKTWKRGEGDDPDALKGAEGAARRMLDVASADSGFVAVGAVAEDKGDQPAVWTSRDGATWAPAKLPLPSGVTKGQLTHVAAKGGTLVAAGTAPSEQGATWLGYVSTDGGATWRELPAPGGEKELTVTAAAATAAGFAVTAVTGAGDSADVVSMTSSDGSAWQVARPEGTGLSGAGAQQITGLAEFQGKTLGVGRSEGPDGEQPVLWTRPGA